MADELKVLYCRVGRWHQPHLFQDGDVVYQCLGYSLDPPTDAPIDESYLRMDSYSKEELWGMVWYLAEALGYEEGVHTTDYWIWDAKKNYRHGLDACNKYHEENK